MRKIAFKTVSGPFSSTFVLADGERVVGASMAGPDQIDLLVEVLLHEAPEGPVSPVEFLGALTATWLDEMVHEELQGAQNETYGELCLRVLLEEASRVN